MKALGNKLGGKHGVGRVDLVENRFVGMKSRRGSMENSRRRDFTLHPSADGKPDTWIARSCICATRSFPSMRSWSIMAIGFSPERLALQALVTESQKNVTGTVRVKLYKGNIITAGRKSPVSLYNPHIATMEADPTQAYNQDDATGFIRLNALRLKVAAQVHQKNRHRLISPKRPKPQMNTDRHRTEKVASESDALAKSWSTFSLKNLCSSVLICGFRLFLELNRRVQYESPVLLRHPRALGFSRFCRGPTVRHQAYARTKPASPRSSASAPTWKAARAPIQIAEAHPQVYAAVGWHPTHVLTTLEDVRPAFARPCAASERSWPSAKRAWIIIAGQTRTRPEADFERYKVRQAELFRQQLEVASELGLNCIIHQRDSFEDTLAQLTPFASRTQGVFHCFSESVESMRQVFALGSLVSFTGIVTFKNGENIRQALVAAAPSQFIVSKPIAHSLPPCRIGANVASRPTCGKSRNWPPASGIVPWTN